MRQYGGVAVNTDPLLPSGSERTAAALRSFDPHGNSDTVINLQGDMPAAEPAILLVALGCFDRGGDASMPNSLRSGTQSERRRQSASGAGPGRSAHRERRAFQPGSDPA